VEAGLDWLQSLSNTQRAYRKEAERFLLWAIVQRGKALSWMTNEDEALQVRSVPCLHQVSSVFATTARRATLTSALWRSSVSFGSVRWVNIYSSYASLLPRS
jgi:hypothetical protein